MSGATGRAARTTTTTTPSSRGAKTTTGASATWTTTATRRSRRRGRRASIEEARDDAIANTVGTAARRACRLQPPHDDVAVAFDRLKTENAALRARSPSREGGGRPAAEAVSRGDDAPRNYGDGDAPGRAIHVVSMAPPVEDLRERRRRRRAVPTNHSRRYR